MDREIEAEWEEVSVAAIEESLFFTTFSFLFPCRICDNIASTLQDAAYDKC
jgi:hypothetical protein